MRNVPRRARRFSVDAAPLVTLALLFAFQGVQFLKQRLVIPMLTVPVLIVAIVNRAERWYARKPGSDLRTTG